MSNITMRDLHKYHSSFTHYLSIFKLMKISDVFSISRENKPYDVINEQITQW